jgi:predicted  nucleic acid-binding Zn-ribbon protein
MHPDLERLRELQELDNRIAELTREISYLPKHIAEIESKLESRRRRLETDRASLAANQKERRRLEDDVKVHEQKIARLRDQMSEAKTNEQYRAFQHEIEYIQGEIRKLEDQILDRMTEAEALDQNVRSAEAALQLESAEVEKEKRAAQQRTEADRAELLEAERRRATVAQAITPRAFALYQRIRRSRGQVAIAAVREGRCTGCNVILRLHYRQQVQLNQEVLTCEACGRILYYAPPEETPKDEPSKEVADCSLQSTEPLP